LLTRIGDIYSTGTTALRQRDGNISQGVVGSIFVPPPGYIPTNSNLRPIHAWNVHQDDRYYNYYSEGYGSAGPDYTYLGIIGYMYSAYGPNSVTLSTPGGPQTFPLNKIRYCYSQSRGYWQGRMTELTTNPYTYSLEGTPNGTYNCSPPHGMVGASIVTNRGTRPNAEIPVPAEAPWTPTPSNGKYYSDIPTGEIFVVPPPPPPPGEGDCLVQNLSEEPCPE